MVTVGVCEGALVEVAVLLGCIGVDVVNVPLVEVGMIAFELCVGCALLLVGWHANNENTHRSKHHKMGCVILLGWIRWLILIILNPLLSALDYPHGLKHRKGLWVDIIVKKVGICRLAFSGCLC
jgi:hypothetical protein